MKRIKKMLTKRVVLGFATLASAALLGTAGLASAAPEAPKAAGYGNTTTTINNEISVDIEGSRNYVQIVINYLFGE